MADSDRLGLPFIAAEQAQKHVTHNEALQGLDALVQLVFTEIDVATPPGSPVAGACYWIGASATGEWTGHDGAIAQWSGSGWRYFTPGEGWRAWDGSGAELVIFDGGDWQSAVGLIGEFNNLGLLGVNSNADSTNRLAVRSNAILFSALEAVNGGTGDLRLALNKESATDTGSLVFQDGFSARAELGLTGDNGLSFKVSSDGSSFLTGMRIDNATGFVNFEQIFGAAPTFPVVASGTLPLTSSLIVPAPESGVADDIDTISGGFDGALLVVAGSSGVTLTFNSGTGNLRLGATRVLDSADDSLMLVRRGSNWLEIAFSDNG